MWTPSKRESYPKSPNSKASGSRTVLGPRDGEIPKDGGQGVQEGAQQQLAVLGGVKIWQREKGDKGEGAPP